MLTILAVYFAIGIPVCAACILIGWKCDWKSVKAYLSKPSEWGGIVLTIVIWPLGVYAIATYVRYYSEWKRLKTKEDPA